MQNRERPVWAIDPCKFVLAKAFNTGELLPMPEFYKKKGFLPTPEGDLLCLLIDGNYEPAKPIGKYEPLPEDKDKAVIFYGPACQFNYPFAKKRRAHQRSCAQHQN